MGKDTLIAMMMRKGSSSSLLQVLNMNNKQREINKAKKRAEELFVTYTLWLTFMDKEWAKYRFVSELTSLLNESLSKLGVSKKAEKEVFDNIFNEKTPLVYNIERVLTTEIQNRYVSHLNTIWIANGGIIGKRISLSKYGKNHCEICKNMVGAYPLTFEWTSFHVNCRCDVTPIYGVAGRIVKMPNRAIKFVKKNRHRFNSWSKKPDWLKNFNNI